MVKMTHAHSLSLGTLRKWTKKVSKITLRFKPTVYTLIDRDFRRFPFTLVQACVHLGLRKDDYRSENLAYCRCKAFDIFGSTDLAATSSSFSFSQVTSFKGVAA